MGVATAEPLLRRSFTMDLEADFEQRLRDSIRESIALGYNPTRFTAMLDN
jgi:hypothetical protein